MVIPRKLFTEVKKVQDTNLICPPVISQYAALGALQAKPEYLKNNIDVYDLKNVNVVEERLESVSRLLLGCDS